MRELHLIRKLTACNDLQTLTLNAASLRIAFMIVNEKAT